jgi:hypothetical protein
MRHHLALVALLALSGSVAYAGPGRHAGRKASKTKKARHEKKVKAPVDLDERDEADDDDDDESEAPRRTKRKQVDNHRRALGTTTTDDDDDDDDDDDESEAPRRSKRKQVDNHRRALGTATTDDEEEDDEEEEEVEESEAPRRSKRTQVPVEDDEDDSDRVALGEELDDEDPDDEDDAAPVKLREVVKGKAQKDWHIAVGPYLWASAVDADVSLGSASVSTGIDFMDIKRHAKYGVEVLAEARYGRFAIHTDFMYGVVGVDGGTDVGPLMVTLDGTASSLLVDGLAGYRLFGSEQSVVSFEARGGVRYQRTSISGSVNVAGTDVSPTTYIDSAADALAGAHAVLRPHWRFYVSGEVDHGVFGASTKTWSATADTGVRITRRVQLSVGWRTLTTTRTNVSIVMHGPRAALQFIF